MIFNSHPEMCIYIGDIGDNHYVRKQIRLYKVKEPKNLKGKKYVLKRGPLPTKFYSIPTDLYKQTINTKDWSRVDFHYPHNKAYNAESMLIDAKNREFIIVTKAKKYSKVFKTALDSSKHSYNIMKDTGITLALSLATDATSSKDGQV